MHLSILMISINFKLTALADGGTNVWSSKHKLQYRIAAPFFLPDEMKLTTAFTDTCCAFSIVREFLDRRVDRYSMTDSGKKKERNFDNVLSMRT